MLKLTGLPSGSMWSGLSNISSVSHPQGDHRPVASECVARLRLASLALLTFILLLTAGCSGASDKAKIVIGAVLPFTGENAQYGENEKKGITLALDEVKKRWPNLSVDVVYEDTRGEAKTGALAIQKLKAQHISFFIDDAMSSVTFAMVPALGTDALMISTGATNPKLSGTSPYFFRIWNSDAEEGAQAAQLSPKVRPGTKKVAVLYVNNDYGVGLKDVYLRDVAKSVPGVLAKDFSFDSAQTNLRDLAAVVRDYNPDLIYMIGYGPQTGLVTRELRAYKIRAPIISTVTTEDPKFLERAGPAAEGVIYVYPKSPSGGEADTFQNLYAQKFGGKPGILADHAYDAVILYAMAFNSGAKTPSDVQHWFQGMTLYNGASGAIKFDANGDIHAPYDLKSVQRGAFAIYHE
jgi:branched-chain amino acid transport system substrate-binding protein